ncbi:MAG: uracil-DNA glycosylase [Tidjanibacter sp.]|nr:uracil-DNA glycosylase [Tidjanibacter sp.]
MNVRINSEWLELLREEFEKPYFAELVEFVRHEYATQRVFPAGKNIFRALDLCPPSKVKVVIIGQDPYHGEGQANGLCFSVNDGIQFPPSLRNIFKEIESDLGTPAPTSGNLDRWAEQGVLLLNATLTVRAHQAASHAGHGWEQFTDAVIAALTESRKGVVYMLWGNYAARKGALVNAEENLVLRSAHPSPLSAYNGFFGSRHFSKANAYLLSQGLEPIEW